MCLIIFTEIESEPCDLGWMCNVGEQVEMINESLIQIKLDNSGYLNSQNVLFSSLQIFVPPIEY